MNEITYVATQIDHTESGIAYGSASYVYLGSERIMAIMVTEEHNPWMAHVVVLPDTGRKVFSMWQRVSLMHDNLTELAQMFPPF